MTHVNGIDELMTQVYTSDSAPSLSGAAVRRGP